MADSNTAVYGLILPEVGSSRDTWGAKWNENLTSIDAIMAALTPVGSVLDFAGSVAPTGYLLCDGTIYPISSYPKLAAVLGATYGGDGVTTFAVPDCRGRVIAGAGGTTDVNGVFSAYALGQKDGRFLAQITQSYLPNYALTI